MRNEKLKEKMQQASYPFDPQAWGDMEKMLDADKRKRRAAIWWWSTAALLLISAGVGAWAWLQTGTLPQQQLAKKVIGMDGREAQLEQSPSATEFSSAHAEAEALALAAEQEQQSTIGNTAAATSQNNNSQTRAQYTSTGSSNPNRAKAFAASANNNKVSAGKLSLNPTQSSNAVTEASVVTPSPLGEKNLAVLMNLLSASLENNPEFLLAEKLNGNDETEKFSKPSQKKFAFELGAIGRSTASFAGKTLSPLPSYEAGLQFGFCFGKHFAINTGVLAGQTNFRVQPATNSDSSANILRFDSRITEVNIPLGMTVVPFSNQRFNFHIGVGLGNHIKLQEKFEVVYKPIATTPPGTTNFDNQVLVQEEFENSFANLDAVVENQLLPPGKTAAVSVSDIALGSPSRYYASGYATMGFDVRAVKQLWFSIDGFASLKPKIGIQNIHQWNAGGSVGIKYRFR